MLYNFLEHQKLLHRSYYLFENKFHLIEKEIKLTDHLEYALGAVRESNTT